MTDTGEISEDQFEKRTGSENELVDKMLLEDERTSTETEPVRNYDRFDNQTGGGSKIELGVVRKSNTNNNYFNNTDINKSNHINPIKSILQMKRM